MKAAVLSFAICAFLSPAMSFGQSSDVEIGKQEYMVACAGCHGESGKGTGPMADLLKIETPDLTTINKRMEQDAFPFQNTLMLVDGRNGIRAHGGDMPLWGDRFMTSARMTEAASETPESADLVTMGRILALVYYLESIQE